MAPLERLFAYEIQFQSRLRTEVARPRERPEARQGPQNFQAGPAEAHHLHHQAPAVVAVVAPAARHRRMEPA